MKSKKKSFRTAKHIFETTEQFFKSVEAKIDKRNILLKTADDEAGKKFKELKEKYMNKGEQLTKEIFIKTLKDILEIGKHGLGFKVNKNIK